MKIPYAVNWHSSINLAEGHRFTADNMKHPRFSPRVSRTPLCVKVVTIYQIKRGSREHAPGLAAVSSVGLSPLTRSCLWGTFLGPKCVGKEGGSQSDAFWRSSPGFWLCGNSRAAIRNAARKSQWVRTTSTQ